MTGDDDNDDSHEPTAKRRTSQHLENKAVRPGVVVPRKQPRRRMEGVEGEEDNNHNNNNVLQNPSDDHDDVAIHEDDDYSDRQQRRPATGPSVAVAASSAHLPTEKDDDFTVGTCRSIRDFVKVTRLGRGTYGVVYEARERTKSKSEVRSHGIGRTAWRNEGTTVALKRCLPHHEATDGFPITALREMVALRHCAGHPNIVQWRDVAVSRSGVFWVLENGGLDVARLVDAHYSRHRCSPFSVAAAKTLVVDLLQAIRHVHSLRIVHRDVKLGNLLYGSDGRLRLADFGLARTYDPHSTLTLPVASLWYRPPELLLGVMTYGSSIDLWACGCVLGELLVGRPLFAGTNESDQMRLILDHLGPWPAQDPHLQYPRLHSCPTPPTAPLRKRLLDVVCPGDNDDGLSLPGWRLLTGLLHYRPDRRWTADQALASPFFGKGRGDAESPALDPPAPLAYADMPRFPSTGN